MKVVTTDMRRTSGFALGTIATLAVLSVMFSLGAGLFLTAPSAAVRTASGISHSIATPSTSSHPSVESKVSAVHASVRSSVHSAALALPPPPPPPLLKNYTLTGVNITPASVTSLEGASTPLAASPICSVTGSTSTACPSEVTYAWSSLTPNEGWVNQTGGSSILAYGNATVQGTAMFSVTASLNNGTATSTATSAPASDFVVAPINVTVTNLTLAPAAGGNLTPGQTLGMTANATCRVNGVANQSCPWQVPVAWSNPTPDLGTLAAATGLSNAFTASWLALGQTAISASETFNNTTKPVTVKSYNAVPINVFVNGAPAISTKFTTNFSLYMHLPFVINWTVTIANGSITPNTTVNLDVRDIPGSSCGLLFFGPAPCPEVVNISEPVASGQAHFSQVINYSTLNSTGYAAKFANGLFPADEYQFLLWVRDNNSVANVAVSGQQNAWPVWFPPGLKFLSPAPGVSIPAGNVTFSLQYYGYLISGATLTVYDSGGKEVYVQGMFAGGLANRSIGAATPWLAETPGTYSAVVNVTTLYGTYSFTQSYTVVATGGTVYVNQSVTHSDNLPGSLSPATFGTVLLVLGLIVGLIVALVLGRLMWGGPAQPASPQPWSPSQGSGGSGGSGGSMGGSGGDSSGGTNKP